MSDDERRVEAPEQDGLIIRAQPPTPKTVEQITEAAAIVRYCESTTTQSAKKQQFVESVIAAAKARGAQDAYEDAAVIAESCTRDDVRDEPFRIAQTIREQARIRRSTTND